MSSPNWDQYQPQLYDSTGAFDEYEIVSGLVVIPIAEQPPESQSELIDWSPVRVVRVHPEYRIRRTSFRNRKTGSPPVLPSPKSSGALIFLGGTLAFQQPQLNSSLVMYNWEGMGQYEFVENCRSSVDDGFLLTNKPFTQTIQAENQLAFQGGQQVALGAVAQAGDDAKSGYVLAQQTSLLTTNYSYSCPSYIPSLFFNEDLVNGAAPIVTPITGPPNYQQPDFGPPN